MPDLEALKLCLSRIEKSPVSTPTARSEGSPASMSGSGVTMLHGRVDSSSHAFLDWSPTLHPDAFSSSRLHSRLQSFASFPALENEDDEPLSYRKEQQAESARRTGKQAAAEEEHKESLAAESARVLSSACPQPSSPPRSSRAALPSSRKATLLTAEPPFPHASASGSTSRNPTRPPPMYASARTRLLGALLASRELRDAFLATENVRRDTRSARGQQKAVRLPAHTHLRVLRSVLRHTAVAQSPAVLLETRQAHRQQYEHILLLEPLPQADRQPHGHTALHCIRDGPALTPTFFLTALPDADAPQREAAVAPFKPPTVSAPEPQRPSADVIPPPPAVTESVPAPLAGALVKGRLRQLMIDKARADEEESRVQSELAAARQRQAEAHEEIERQRRRAEDEAMALRVQEELDREEAEAQQALAREDEKRRLEHEQRVVSARVAEPARHEESQATATIAPPQVEDDEKQRTARERTARREVLRLELLAEREQQERMAEKRRLARAAQEEQRLRAHRKGEEEEALRHRRAEAEAAMEVALQEHKSLTPEQTVEPVPVEAAAEAPFLQLAEAAVPPLAEVAAEERGPPEEQPSAVDEPGDHTARAAADAVSLPTDSQDRATQQQREAVDLAERMRISEGERQTLAAEVEAQPVHETQDSDGRAERAETASDARAERQRLENEVLPRVREQPLELETDREQAPSADPGPQQHGDRFHEAPAEAHVPPPPSDSDGEDVGGREVDEEEPTQPDERARGEEESKASELPAEADGVIDSQAQVAIDEGQSEVPPSTATQENALVSDLVAAVASPIVEEGQVASRRDSQSIAAMRNSSLSVPRTSILLGEKSPLTRSPNSVISRTVASAAPLPSDSSSPFALEGPAPAPVAAAAAVSAVPAWITAADRDGLFDYLAGDADVFTTDMTLNDSALNTLLAAGGSLASTVALLKLIEGKGVQANSIDELRAIIEVEAEAARAAESVAVITPPVPTEGVEWVTDADRDGLFQYLAAETCALFSADVKLNNRALGDILVQGGSLAAAIRVLGTLQEQRKEFATVDDLLRGMKDVQSAAATQSQLPVVSAPSAPSIPQLTLPVASGPAVEAPAVPHAIVAEIDGAAAAAQEAAAPPVEEKLELKVISALKANGGSRRPSSFSFPTAAVASASTSAVVNDNVPSTHWVTERDRDALVAFFHAPTTHLFTAPTALPPALLTAMLSLSGSVYTCIEALSSLQRKGILFVHPTPLLLALQSEMALLYPAPVDGSERPPSPHAFNRTARDALFQYLSSAYCHLFSASVKLNNLTLDHLIFQGRGLQCALACCHHLDELGQQFPTPQALTVSVARAASQREAEESALLTLLQHPQHQKALFTQSLQVDPADVSRMWLSVQAGDETMAYVLLVEEDVLMRGREKLAGVDDLRHEVQRRHAAMRVERRKEMERLYEVMHQPTRRVLGRGTIVSMEECGRLVTAGREDLRAERPCQTIRIVGDLETQHEQCAGVDALIQRVADCRKRMMVALGEKPLVPPTPSVIITTKVKAAATAAAAAPAAVSGAWIGGKERDALFDWLASEECALFSTNVKLNNRALDSMLMAGGSLQATLDAARELNSTQAQFTTVDGLRTAIASRTKALSAASLAPPSAPTALVISGEDRDAVFTVLAEETELFLTDVKLTNKALDSIIQAGGGRASTIEQLKAIHTRQQQFPSIAALVTAVAGAKAAGAATASDKDRDALATRLTGPSCALFNSAVRITNADVDAMLVTGKGLKTTLALLRRIESYPMQFSSLPALLRVLATLSALPPMPAAVDSATFSVADRDALFDYLASEACNVFRSNIKLSNKTLDKLLASGRTLQSTLAILRLINTRAEQVDSVPQLLAVVEAEFAAAYDALVDLTIFFASPASPLPTVPAPAALLDVYWAAEAGTDLIHHLRAVPSSPLPGLSALLPLLSASRVTDLIQVNADIAALYQQLGTAAGGKTSRTGRKGLRGVLAKGRLDGLSMFECSRLARAGRVGLGASKGVAFVNELLDAKKTFATADELISAVQAISDQQQPLAERRNVVRATIV